MPEFQPFHGHDAARSARSRFLRSQVLICVAAFLVMVPLFAYYSHLIGMNGNSDSAMDVLKSWDMFHGRPLLNGWTQGNNSWMTNELIIYAVVASVLGVTPTVIYVSHGILYSALIVLTAVLAMGRARDWKRAALAGAFAGAMLIGVTRETTGWMTLTLIDHLTTAIPILVLLIIFDRAKALTWHHGVVAFANLTWAAMSDHIVIYVAILPLALVSGLRAYFRKDHRRVNAVIALGALAALPGERIFKALVQSLGGAAPNDPPGVVFAGVAELPANFWETIHSLMIIFGAGIFGRDVSSAKIQLIHVAVVATAVAGWIIAMRSLRNLNLIDQFILTAILVNVLALMFSRMPGSDDAAHEMLIVVPLSVALAARLIVPRLISLRAQIPVYAGFALSVALLGHALTGTATPDRNGELTRWLQDQRLTYGLASYWESSSVTVKSSDKVQVRAILNSGPGNVQTFRWIMRDDWYDPAQHDARFVITKVDSDTNFDIAALGNKVVSATFGTPQRTVHIGDFIVRIYDYNLLTRVPR